MYTEAALRNEGMRILIDRLGKVEAERFIAKQQQGIISRPLGRDCASETRGPGAAPGSIPVISLMNREAFDYTEWQRDLFEGMSVREISSAATKESAGGE